MFEVCRGKEASKRGEGMSGLVVRQHPLISGWPPSLLKPADRRVHILILREPERGPVALKQSVCGAGRLILGAFLLHRIEKSSRPFKHPLFCMACCANEDLPGGGGDGWEGRERGKLDQVLAKLFWETFDQVGSGTCWQLQVDLAIGMSESKLSSPSIDLGRATN